MAPWRQRASATRFRLLVFQAARVHHHFYGEEAIWQGVTYNEPRYYPEAITDHALDFLGQAGARPFFLYVGYNGPYGLDLDMLTGHRNRHTAYYADKKLRCFPREDAHPWLRMYRDRIKNETAMRSYACAVSGVDDGVGAILDALAVRNLDRTQLSYSPPTTVCVRTSRDVGDG